MYDKQSPAANLNKGYGMESNSTEKKDLMKDNPIARDASGSRPVGGSWMSKHSKSMGSPMKMNSPLNDFKGGLHKVEHAKGEAHQGSPATMKGNQGSHKMTAGEYGRHLDRHTKTGGHHDNSKPEENKKKLKA